MTFQDLKIYLATDASKTKFVSVVVAEIPLARIKAAQVALGEALILLPLFLHLWQRPRSKPSDASDANTCAHLKPSAGEMASCRQEVIPREQQRSPRRPSNKQPSARAW